MSKKRITIERSYDAAIEDVWDLWTTKEGIESWWGPEGFTVTVQKLDLRAGGELLYTMTATGPDQIAFMQRAGMPIATKTRITFDDVVPPRRLAYTNLVDFVPGVEPYGASQVIELSASGGQVRMVLTLDAMHDETWTSRAVMGWESELGKLAKVLAARR
ncbi:MAG: Activator of Hsp90 ATPase 1 family protein [Myxococcales bacterium]|nr:Activator of Hsp90 ATPase 1 family protein [Myxococcales bacterium]